MFGSVFLKFDLPWNIIPFKNWILKYKWYIKIIKNSFVKISFINVFVLKKS